MRLLTAETRSRLPALYVTENDPDAKAVLKLFLPGTRWTWYVSEFDGDDLLYGYVLSGLERRFDECGYSSLSELESLRGPYGFNVERDRAFRLTMLRDIAERGEIV